jgi:hypothetical protein
VPEKERLSEELQSTLEGWYGGELELTSIYGIRYAVLLFLLLSLLYHL